MASSSVCWGIEIGATAIKALKLEAVGDGQVKVLDYAIVPHPKPLSSPDVKADDVLRVSLGQFISQVDLSKAAISISIPGHAAFARFAKLPPVEPKKVPDVVKFEAMQQIPFPLEQVEWDYQTFTPEPPDVEVGIFAVTKERVTERLQMLGDVGLTPNYVVLSPIAVYNALAYDLDFANDTPGTIIVDVGTTSTDLVIATPGRMWVRTFPLGGHQFTQALVEQFQLGYAKAEKLKREAEDSKHARQVFQAMRPVFTDLSQDVQRSIGYYSSLNKDASLTRLIGVGSTFALPGLRKYLKQQLSLDVYRIEGFKKLTLEGERAAAFNEASLTLVTAYGLALHGLGLNAVGGNLMPTAVLRKSMWKDKIPAFAAAAGLAVAAGAAMFIRPVIDSAAISAAQPDPVINRSITLASTLRTEADQLGVLSAGEPNLTAANLVDLAAGSDVVPQLVRDLKVIVASATERAGTWAESIKEPAPAAGAPLEVLSFTTTYEAPGSGGSDGGMESDFGADPAADPLAAIRPHPRILIEARIATNQPQARRFFQETVQRWLRSNATRAGVPYTIVIDPAGISLTDATGAAVPGGTPSAGIPGEVEPPRGLRPDDQRRPPGRIIGEGRGNRPIGPPSGAGGGGFGGDPGSEGPDPAADEVRRLAPLNLGGESAARVNARTSIATIRWYVAFLPAPAGDANNPNSPGSTGGTPRRPGGGG